MHVIFPTNAPISHSLEQTSHGVTRKRETQVSKIDDAIKLALITQGCLVYWMYNLGLDFYDGRSCALHLTFRAYTLFRTVVS